MPTRVLPVEEVFTPTSQARANFVARPELDASLMSALRTPGKQVVVYGESGSGKSTLLLNKLSALYDAFVTVHCSRLTTFQDLLLDAFDQLEPFYLDALSTQTTSASSASISAQFEFVKAAVNASSSEQNQATSRRVVPPQLTTQRLARFLGEKSLCWVIEDFHKVSAEEKVSLSQTLKVFSDMAVTYPKLRIVAIGATDTARDVVQYDNEMRNRVAEIHVPLMVDHQLREIVVNGGRLLNVRLDRIADKITSFSSGLASVTHHLALNACRAAGIEETQSIQKALLDSEMDAAVAAYIAESSDTLKSRFDAALRRDRERKYHNTELLIKAIAGGPFEGLTHAAILAKIRLEHPEYPSGNVTLYLGKLQEDERGALIRKTTNGRFRFIDPVLHSYARALYKPAMPDQPESSWLTILTRMVEDQLLERGVLRDAWPSSSGVDLEAQATWPRGPRGQ